MKKENKNAIGLDISKTNDLIEELNDLLANYQVFYQNTRGLHWNIKGQKFFELHIKYEELYTYLQLKIDEIAERILALGGTPMHTFEDYLKQSKIKSQKNITDARKGVKLIIESLETIIIKQRHILKLTEDLGDEGSNNLISDYILEQEKMVWMYSAYLKE